MNADERQHDLDEAVSRAVGARRERDRLARQVGELERALAEQQRAVEAAEQAAGRERGDVEGLEGLTLDRVLAALRGCRGDDLERERAELQAAVYRLRQEQARLSVVEQDLASVRSRLSALGPVDAHVERALAAKEADLRARADDPRAAEVAEIATSRGTLDDELREVEEAVVAAEYARSALAVVEECLGSAGSWSTYDTWLGGGMVGSMVKHRRIEEAQQAAARAESQLARLRREVSDVGGSQQVVPALRIGELQRFLDIWFDNIFTDWSVASRIRDAQRTTREAGRTVASVRSELEARRQALRKDRAELERRRAALLGDLA